MFFLTVLSAYCIHYFIRYFIRYFIHYFVHCSLFYSLLYSAFTIVRNFSTSARSITGAHFRNNLYTIACIFRLPAFSSMHCRISIIIVPFPLACKFVCNSCEQDYRVLAFPVLVCLFCHFIFPLFFYFIYSC